MQDDLFSAYNGTYGSVDRITSIEREQSERESGKLSERAQSIMLVLFQAGKWGMTWDMIGKELELHHGQVSGVLSNLHKKHKIFSLSQKLEGEKSLRYVHSLYAGCWHETERYDSPVQTKAGVRKQALESLLWEIKLINTSAELFSRQGLENAIQRALDEFEKQTATTPND